MKYEFTKNTPEKENELMLAYLENEDGTLSYLEAWDEEDWWSDISSDMLMDKEESEFVLNHDLALNTGFVKALADYIAESVREVRFGRWNTKTYVFKLKPNWKELCVPLEG